MKILDHQLANRFNISLSLCFSGIKLLTKKSQPFQHKNSIINHTAVLSH